MKETLIIVGVTLAALIGLVFLAQPRQSQSVTAPSQPTVLTADEAAYDFGTISLAAGKVKKTFAISNPGAAPVTLTRLYTSCMCTTAALQIGERWQGPFGMIGHGFMPSFKETILPDETAAVSVTFDPAAHGPAGVGLIERAVYLENSAGGPLILTIKANVTP